MISPDAGGSLRDWDLIVVNSSGGKDSQTALRTVAMRAAREGVLDRVVVLHCDLGDRVEWPGMTELAADQAAHYGVRFEVYRRAQGGDLWDEIERRGRFPSKAARYCTSYYKREPGARFLTAEVRRLGLRRPARVLYVFGFRAEESDDRAAKVPFSVNGRASNQTRRHVWDWYPIHAWPTTKVWTDIRLSGVAHHWAYDAGMTRLSCSFCVLASRADLVKAAQLRPDRASELAELEVRIGHTIQPDLSMAQVIEAAGACCSPAA